MTSPTALRRTIKTRTGAILAAPLGRNKGSGCASPVPVLPCDSMAPRISASIICRDEEPNIEDCLRSVAWCDEIVVVDSGSTDRTVEIARRFTPKVLVRPWPGYVAQKNFALEQTTGEWVICLDADERCTPELRAAFEGAAKEAVAGFEVRRRTWYLGRWIRHGGWYPGWKLRIVRRKRARWGGRDPHDKLIPDGPVRRLEADLLHFPYRDFSHQLRTIHQYSDIVVDDWVRQGRRLSLSRMVLHPPIKFLECFVWKQGFRDGWPGLVIAMASAFYIFVKHAKLWERGLKPPTRNAQ